MLFVGRFVEKKGIPTLLDAIAILRAEGNPLRLVLVGDGPLGPLVAGRAAERVAWLTAARSLGSTRVFVKLEDYGDEQV